MRPGLLFETNLVVILVVLVGASLLAAEAGFRLGRRHHRLRGDAGRANVSTLQGALLGLLALLLGFSFAMAHSRFDTRKLLVLQEANAIGTAILRAQLLQAPEGQQVADLLRQYVEVRLVFHEAGLDEGKLRYALAETDRLQAELWAGTVTAVERSPRPATTGLFVQAVNAVIELHAMRVNAMRNHIPEGVLWLLYFVTVLAMGMTGYGSGLGGDRNTWPTVTTAVLISVVVVVIMDLDRPHRGFITVGQSSMLDLRESLRRPAP